ncbi:MAG TPA: GAF domain-containing sensor histidine kinase [Longimicrobium sp.]
MVSDLAALTALAQALSRSADLAESLDAALATVAEVLGLETGWVWLLEEGDPEPRLAAARALPPALRDHPRAMHGDCHCLKTFRDGDLRGAANVNVVWCSRLEKVVRSDGDVGLHCHASVPLAVGSRHLGMLNVAAPDWRVLSEQELNLLTTAGALVSLTLERQRLEAASARAAAAEERNLLAREIHDTLAQGLAALTMQLEVADSLAAGTDDARLAAAIARSLTLARSTLDEARRSVLDLRAAPLDGRTLPDALLDLAASFQGEGDGMEIEMEIDGFDDAARPLPPGVEAGMYRIAQQALANATRHAQARRVVVRLARTGDALELSVADDGIGFDVGAVPAGRFGLVGMSERARLLGGTAAVDSAPGAGTRVEVRVPLRPGAHETRETGDV